MPTQGIFPKTSSKRFFQTFFSHLFYLVSHIYMTQKEPFRLKATEDFSPSLESLEQYTKTPTLMIKLVINLVQMVSKLDTKIK